MEQLRKIVLVGAECTGKTALAQALAAHLQTVWSPEYARLYVEAKWRAKKVRSLSFNEVTNIAWGQACLEDHFEATANKYLVCDTNLLSTAVYAQYYFNKVPQLVETLLAQRPAHLYLLLDTDLPWQADPARDSPEARAQIQICFKEALERRKLPYQILKEPYLDGTQDYSHRRLAHWADLL